MYQDTASFTFPVNLQQGFDFSFSAHKAGAPFISYRSSLMEKV